MSQNSADTQLIVVPALCWDQQHQVQVGARGRQEQDTMARQGWRSLGSHHHPLSPPAISLLTGGVQGQHKGSAASQEGSRPLFPARKCQNFSLPKKLSEANPVGLLRLSHFPAWCRRVLHCGGGGRMSPSPHPLTNWFAPKLWFMKLRTCELGTSWFKRWITEVIFWWFLFFFFLNLSLLF